MENTSVPLENMLEVIDAFVDGERVSPRALKDALADPAGRDYFVEVWMLREAMQEERESREIDPLQAPVHEPAPAPIAPRRAIGTWIAAAALVVAVAGGYLAGHLTSQPASPQNAPPTTPVAALPAAPAPVLFPAPPPTRVIQLEFQLDSSTGGGN